MLDEKNFEKFVYGHPTINGKETIYQGRKVKKKVKEEVPTYDLSPAHNLLSNILHSQMEKNKKKMENINFSSFEDETNGSGNTFNSSLNNFFSNNQTNMNSYNNNMTMSNMTNYNNNNFMMNNSTQMNNGLIPSLFSELEKEAQRANREFCEREKARNNMLMNGMNNQIMSTQNTNTKNVVVDPNKPVVKRKRGRPPKNQNLNNTLNTYFNNDAKKPEQNITPNNENTNQAQTQAQAQTQTQTQTQIQTQVQNPPQQEQSSLIKKERKERTPRKFTKRMRGRSYNDLFYGNRYDPMMDDNENNDMNLLEILFKEYGYNNIIYVLTDSPEIKLGETKIKKIKNGLNTLLGCENNISKVIETIVKMRKSNLIDESWIKGKYNYRTRNKNNLYIASYHYQLNNDGFIYKFKHQKILHDGSIRFICCDPKCNGRGVLFPRIKMFKMFSKHSLAPLQHDYMKNGYDKFQYKMERKSWKEISLKDNPDDKKTYIDWHKPYIEPKI